MQFGLKTHMPKHSQKELFGGVNNKEFASKQDYVSASELMDWKWTAHTHTHTQ